MKRQPSFFMTTAAEMSVKGDLARVRACWCKGRLTDGFRDDYMLAEIDPSVIGQHYGLGDQDITELIIAARLRGDTVFPVSRWPLPV